jgi:hypothetical protein
LVICATILHDLACKRDVSFGSKADIGLSPVDVRYFT